MIDEDALSYQNILNKYLQSQIMHFPAEISDEKKAILESLGFIFLEVVQDVVSWLAGKPLFWYAVLPKDWTIVAFSAKYHDPEYNDCTFIIFDQYQNKRVIIDYSLFRLERLHLISTVGPFAHVYIAPRYNYQIKQISGCATEGHLFGDNYSHGSILTDGIYACSIKDFQTQQIIFITKNIKAKSSITLRSDMGRTTVQYQLFNKTTDWLNKNYPNWQDSTAYWGKP